MQTLRYEKIDLIGPTKNCLYNQSKANYNRIIYLPIWV